MKVIRVGPMEILGLNFNEVFDPIMALAPDPYFNLPPGKEHYRLLSYLSTQFENANILDIGTARGHSALALAFNKTNTVHSFDITNHLLNPLVQSLPNVRYYLENLWEDATIAKYIDLIKSSPLIFMDVDPHEGRMELAFYQFLKNIGYQGILICDDIHHFEGMRRFWAQIPMEEKYDISRYGHWSGTGLVRFSTNTMFEFVA